MMASGLAHRYATALFELAREAGALDVVSADLGQLRQILEESADLRRAVANPVLSRDVQKRIIESIAERAGFHQLTRNTVALMAEKRRLIAVDGVIRAFAELLSEHKGEVGAEIVTAVPLSSTQLEVVTKALAEHVGKDVSVETSVDSSIIGGMVVRIGSKMIDASLRTKLQQLEISMRGVG